jgi:hypothetical protein
MRERGEDALEPLHIGAGAGKEFGWPNAPPFPFLRVKGGSWGGSCGLLEGEEEEGSARLRDRQENPCESPPVQPEEEEVCEEGKQSVRAFRYCKEPLVERPSKASVQQMQSARGAVRDKARWDSQDQGSVWRSTYAVVRP